MPSQDDSFFTLGEVLNLFDGSRQVVELSIGSLSLTDLCTSSVPYPFKKTVATVQQGRHDLRTLLKFNTSRFDSLATVSMKLSSNPIALSPQPSS